MKSQHLLQKAIRVALCLGAAGIMTQVNCLGKVARNVNPCGTVLNCDPIEYDLLWADFPDYQRDPTCTIPGLCGAVFPFTPVGGAQ